MSNRRRLASKRVGGWFTTETHNDSEEGCSCDLRPVELVDNPAPRCGMCEYLIDVPPEVPLPSDIDVGQIGPLGFACCCGAPPVDLLVRVVA